MNRVDKRMRCKPGFTMIELMLAMTFISVLLVLIMMTVIQITNIYNKGISMREVNQTGRAIAEDLQRSISASSPFAVTGTDNRYIEQDGGGRLCIGQYSYLWNYGNASTPPNIYDDNEVVRMVKLADPAAEYCTAPGTPIPSAKKADVIDMLKSGDRDLAIHGFNISLQPSASDPATEQAIYSIQFIIGTNNQEALTTNSANCAPPSESEGEENYCAVNKFDIIARSGNEEPLKE